MIQQHTDTAAKAKALAEHFGVRLDQVAIVHPRWGDTEPYYKLQHACFSVYGEEEAKAAHQDAVNRYLDYTEITLPAHRALWSQQRGESRQDEDECEYDDEYEYDDEACVDDIDCDDRTVMLAPYDGKERREDDFLIYRFR